MAHEFAANRNPNETQDNFGNDHSTERFWTFSEKWR